MALSNEGARVLLAVADGPDHASVLARRKGVALTDLCARTGLSSGTCKRAAGELREAGYVIQVPGTANAQRWDLSKRIRDKIVRDAESADVVTAAYDLRNPRSGTVVRADLLRLVANDYKYGAERAAAIIDGLARADYYLRPDARAPGYFVVLTGCYEYEKTYIELQRTRQGRASASETS
jgi:hypothetical protein